jgi:hypothetical protein
MNLPMVQCMLWSVVETIMNIEPELNKRHHISMNEPSNGTMYTMVCCRERKVHTNVMVFLVQVEYSRWSLQQTIAYIVPLEGSY